MQCRIAFRQTPQGQPCPLKVGEGGGSAKKRPRHAVEIGVKDGGDVEVAKLQGICGGDELTRARHGTLVPTE